MSRRGPSIGIVALASALAFRAGFQDLRSADAPEPEATTRFVLADAWARPGENVDVDFGVDTAETLSMVSWSIEYDPALFEFVEPVLSPELRVLTDSPLATEMFLDWYADPEGGWAQVDLVVDFPGRLERSLPPGLSRRLAALRFRVLPDAATGLQPLRFSRPDSAPYASRFGGASGDGSVYNAARAAGAPLDPETRFQGGRAPELEDGSIIVAPIIGDVGIFVRGDANLDFDIDLSDPITILDTLFFSTTSFPCAAAADANRDAEIDISDPITILNYLFLGAGDWTPTAERVGESDGGLPCDELYAPEDHEAVP